MKNNTILTYDDVKAMQSGNSDEKLVDVRSYDNSIITQYEKFDMIAYTGLEILVRETVAKKLAIVSASLKNKYGLMLKIVYGYRALEVQRKYFNETQAKLRVPNPGLSREELAVRTHNFVAVPEVAGHVTGGAVDVTLVNPDGVACDMGTRVADFADENRIKTFAIEITVNQRQLRQILLDEMTSVGFAPFLGEWWHFSYGDKEWAAYYYKSRALYGPIDMQKTTTVLRIAGGNETVLQSVRGDVSQKVNEYYGKALLAVSPSAEQAGLVDIMGKRLEMAGGEFCGNASAAAAVLLANELGKTKVSYSVSGFSGNVIAKVARLNVKEYRVRTSFNGPSYKMSRKGQLDIVDMGGIIHILVESEFPMENYEAMQRELVSSLNLKDRKAVGVIWYERQKGKARINPVVWVNEADTLYYESACGSGAIAVAISTGLRDIIQPTGECIRVDIKNDKVITECKVTIISEG